MNKQYFTELSGFNVWATDIFCTMLQQVSDEQWMQNITSSFNSLQETTLHTVSAEKAWLQRFKKEKVEWLQFNYKGSKEEHLELWKQTSADLKKFIETFDENELTTILQYKRLNGDEMATPFYVMFAHVFNHSTYHRGQLITMLRQVGFTDIKSTDILGFFRDKK